MYWPTGRLEFKTFFLSWVGRLVRQSEVSQSVSQFARGQSVSTSINISRLSVTRSLSPSAPQSVSQLVSQSVSQSVTQSVCLSVCQSVSQLNSFSRHFRNYHKLVSTLVDMLESDGL